ncbi:hypothetical protein IAU60_000958 [Kwoniella sp. DSM 27419]
MFTPRISRPLIVVVVAAVISLFLFFAPFTSHGEGNRTRLKGVLESVTSNSKGGWGSLRYQGSQAQDEDWDEAKKMREWEFKRALQYEGTGSRIQAFLEKARSGKPFTVAVIGGSVSKGRGLAPPPGALDTRADSSEIDLTEVASDALAQVSAPGTGTSADSQQPKQMGASTLYSHQNLHWIIFDWLNKAFPNPGNKFVNGAQGGVGAGYFGWCFKEHIPEDSDLVLVEQGINDLLDIEVIGLYEHLLRGLLELPNKPAVINIETFTTLFPSLLSSSAFHQGVLNFYDVPSIAIRDVLLPRLLADPKTQMPRWFRTGDDVTLGDAKVKEYGGVPVDVMHISARGHALAASLVIRYLREQNDRSAPPSRYRPLSRLAYSYFRRPPLRILDVPSTSLTGKFNPYQRDLKHTPVCRSENSPRLHGAVSSAHEDLSHGESQGLTLSPQSHGWTRYAFKEKRYLIAKDPGAVAEFEFIISPPVVQEVSDETALLATSDPVQPNLVEAVDGGESADESLEAELEIELETGEEVREAATETGSRPGGPAGRFDPLPMAMRPGGPYNPHAQNFDNTRRARARDRGARRRSVKSKSSRPTPRGGGSVMIGYLRSAHLGLGSVSCWVDGDRTKGTRVDGWWKMDKRNMGMVKKVASDLEPGKHTLHCELLRETLDPSGGTEFRLFAVMHD